MLVAWRVQVIRRIALGPASPEEGRTPRVEGGRDGGGARRAVGKRREEAARKLLGRAIEDRALPADLTSTQAEQWSVRRYRGCLGSRVGVRRRAAAAAYDGEVRERLVDSPCHLAGVAGVEDEPFELWCHLRVDKPDECIRRGNHRPRGHPDSCVSPLPIAAATGPGARGPTESPRVMPARPRSTATIHSARPSVHPSVCVCRASRARRLGCAAAESNSSEGPVDPSATPRPTRHRQDILGAVFTLPASGGPGGRRPNADGADSLKLQERKRVRRGGEECAVWSRKARKLSPRD